MQKKRHSQRAVERYALERSPFRQSPTQRKVAELLGETKADLHRLANFKEQFIVRRQIVTGRKSKTRDLAYPVSRLRAVHEKMKFHLNKIKQPDYLYSPRRGRGQRDNAVEHLDQEQYLTLDIKKFYPSTTSNMVRRWFVNELGMYGDVAALLSDLFTIDGRASFGSPLTPVLCSLVHRPMFDEIAALCHARGLAYSVWVDDLTISGRFVPREVLDGIREIVRRHGLKSHSIAYRSGNRPVYITGIGVVGASLVAPNSLNLKIRELWTEYHDSVTSDEKDDCYQRLMSQLGIVRHIRGSKSKAGQKAASQMNTLRQERANRQRLAEELLTGSQMEFSPAAVSEADAPW